MSAAAIADIVLLHSVDVGEFACRLYDDGSADILDRTNDVRHQAEWSVVHVAHQYMGDTDVLRFECDSLSVSTRAAVAHALLDAVGADTREHFAEEC